MHDGEKMCPSCPLRVAQLYILLRFTPLGLDSPEGFDRQKGFSSAEHDFISSHLLLQPGMPPEMRGSGKNCVLCAHAYILQWGLSQHDSLR